MLSPFYIGFRRGMWQANIIGLPWIIAVCVYQRYYWLALASAVLFVVVVWTWPWAGRRW